MKLTDDKTKCMGEDCPYKKSCEKCNAEDKRNMEKSKNEKGFHSTEFVEVKKPDGTKAYIAKPAE